MKNKIFHTQDLCLRTNLRCAESCARMEIFMSAKDTMENKITEGVIWKQLLLFFFPILVGTFFQQLYNTVDAVIVGRFVGKEALSCVSGSSGQIINLVVGFFTGLSAGATVMISQHFGAKNEEQLHKALHTAYAFAITGGIIAGVIGVVMTRMVLKWMNTPENLLPEFAFAGKSNVGKSSLINGLLNRRALARTSSQPGKTQTINFYNVNDDLYFVDLPGYGYAKVSVEVKAKWGKMIERYLKKSKMLKCIFLLIDIRHDPSANDKMMYDWIVSNGYKPVIIATKLDKLKRSQIQKHVKMVREGLGLEKEDVLIPFSAETKQGRDEIWALIESLQNPAPKMTESE